MATQVPGSRVTPIEPGMIAAITGKPHLRLVAGKWTITGIAGPRDFFGPLQPLPPLAQDQAQGRQFDYPVGWNVRLTPRQQEGLSWDTLRNMADGYDVLRTIIETRKDQVSGASWSVGPRDQDQKRDKRSDMLEEFWSSPDRTHTWGDWIRMLMEQLFVLDAPALYARRTRGGELFGLEILDGATINRLITEDGRTPAADEGPAYQQILKGLPAVDYTADELLYKPRNVRVDRVYGYSPVEQIVTTVNIALNRQLYQLNYYTSGSTPDLIFQVPETWNPDQIQSFKQWWDSVLIGNLENRRGTMFVPKGVAPYDTKERALKDEYDEWLTRVCCFAFSISPQPFVRSMNRATAETAREMTAAEGLGPILNWIVDLTNVVHAKYFGWPDLVLRFEEDDAVNPLQQAQINQIYLDGKVYHPDEIRQQLGDDPMSKEMRLELDEPPYSPAMNASVLPPGQGADGESASALPKPAPGVAGKLGKGVRRSSRSTRAAALY